VRSFGNIFSRCCGGGGDGAPVSSPVGIVVVAVRVGPKVGNVTWTGRWAFSLISIEEDLDPKSLGGILLFTSKAERASFVCLFICLFFHIS
jgi:hypothetical protein